MYLISKLIIYYTSVTIHIQKEVMTMIYQMHYIVNSGSSLRLTSDKPHKDKGTVLGLVKNCGSEVFIYG